jgi:hypothetical protein
MTNTDFQKWEFGALNLYNFDAPGTLACYYDHIKQHALEMTGHIAEFGVYQGKSLISTALLLKKLGSDKKVYGFDSFSGFPKIHEKDNFSHFEQLYKDGKISKKHFENTKLNFQHRQVLQDNLNVENISNSGNFGNCNEDVIQKKYNYLDVNNVILVKGDFSDTLPTFDSSIKFSAVLLDCDLYQGYMDVLEFAWPRMTPGGIIYLDEYFSLKFPGARIACDEFFEKNRITPVQFKPDFNDDFERWYIIKQ